MATKNAVIAARGPAGAPTENEVPLSTERIRPKLPCKESVFQRLCETAWGYCDGSLLQFSAESPRFTPTYVQQQLTLAASLAKLPSINSRRAGTKMARTQLLVKTQALRMLAQKLKTYILYAYPEKVLADAALSATGLDTYSDSSTNWANISAMIKGSNKFMTDKLAKLMERDNMPGDFPKAFEDAGKAFDAAWTAYRTVEDVSYTGTVSQDAVQQQLLDELLPMLELGKRIFRFEPETYKKFMLPFLQRQVQGHHPAGVKGRATLEVGGKPLANVLVSAMVVGEMKTVLTDKKGTYELQLPNGTYDIHFYSEGMEPLTVAGRLVRPGVMGRLSVELRPVPVAQPAEKSPVEPRLDTDTMLRQAINDLATNGMVEAEH